MKKDFKRIYNKTNDKNENLGYLLLILFNEF